MGFFSSKTYIINREPFIYKYKCPRQATFHVCNSLMEFVHFSSFGNRNFCFKKWLGLGEGVGGRVVYLFFEKGEVSSQFLFRKNAKQYKITF